MASNDTQSSKSKKHVGKRHSKDEMAQMTTAQVRQEVQKTEARKEAWKVGKQIESAMEQLINDDSLNLAGLQSIKFDLTDNGSLSISGMRKSLGSFHKAYTGALDQDELDAVEAATKEHVENLTQALQESVSQNKANAPQPQYVSFAPPPVTSPSASVPASTSRPTLGLGSNDPVTGEQPLGLTPSQGAEDNGDSGKMKTPKHHK